MPATCVYGAISVHEAYTIDMLAQIFNRDTRWVRETFIRPIDHQTGERLKNTDGNPIQGVFHFQKGGQYLIPGQSLMAWLIEHGERATE